MQVGIFVSFQYSVRAVFNPVGGFERCQNLILSGVRINILFPRILKEKAKVWLTFLEWLKAKKKAGLFTDWGVCCDGSSGYCLAETNEAALHSTLLKYQPYIIFNARPVSTIEQAVESINRAVAAAESR